MNKQMEMVLNFYKKVNAPVGEYSKIPPNDRIEVLMRLLEEEGFELRAALMKCKFDMVSPKTQLMGDLMKEVCDNIYTCLAVLVEFGLANSYDHGFDLVHESNMTKTGNNVYRGNVMKGASYVPPNMEKLFI